jgi:hypothetical protein
MFASRQSTASTLVFLTVGFGAFFGPQTGTALADTHWSAGTAALPVLPVLSSTEGPLDTHWNATLQTFVEDTHW